MTPLRLATRMSPMAVAQSQQVATAISARTGGRSSLSACPPTETSAQLSSLRSAVPEYS
jgi:porphobilinogen deaminase